MQCCDHNTMLWSPDIFDCKIFECSTGLVDLWSLLEYPSIIMMLRCREGLVPRKSTTLLKTESKEDFWSSPSSSWGSSTSWSRCWDWGRRKQMFWLSASTTQVCTQLISNKQEPRTSLQENQLSWTISSRSRSRTRTSSPPSASMLRSSKVRRCNCRVFCTFGPRVK